MPRFHFDMHTKNGVISDEVGRELGDPAAVIKECIEAVQDIECDLLDGVERVTVRNERDEIILSVFVSALR